MSQKLELVLAKLSGEIQTTWAELNKQLGYPSSSGNSLRMWAYTQRDRLEREQCEEDTESETLLKNSGLNPHEWDLKSAHFRSKGTSIRVVPKQDPNTLEEFQMHFAEFAKSYTPKFPEVKINNDGDLMLEIPIMDLHFGKLAWQGETGESYDSKIAEDRLMSAITSILSRIKSQKFKKVLFPVGQDFFNFDTISGTTTGGTPQHNDLRWQKMFLKGVELLIKCIDLISTTTKCEIDVFYVAGNHDKATSYYAVTYLSAWYRNSTQVRVDTCPTVRKYRQHGKVLLGFSHGSEERKRIKGLMQIEACKMWGESLYREWHLGHLHSEHTTEENGLIIRKISSITGTDAWHKESGYVGSIKKLQAFVWHTEDGLTDIINGVIK